jgi:hypothetical protein
MTMNTMRLSYLLGCVALLAVPGCTMDAADADLDEEAAEAQEATPEKTESAIEALKSSGEVGWSQGQAAQGLGPTSDRVCLLTGLRGNFAGFGENVRVSTSGGSWYLGGTSGTSGVGAWATCAYVDSYTGEYAWQTGQDYPTALGSATKRMCFITRVSGAFNSSADWVHVYVQSGQWFITGESTSSGVRVGARCVDVPDGYGSEVSWSNNALAKYVGTAVGKTCGLTRIQGQFDSGQDVLQCDRITDSWYLTGKATSGYVGGRARLF